MIPADVKNIYDLDALITEINHARFTFVLEPDEDDMNLCYLYITSHQGKHIEEHGSAARLALQLGEIIKSIDNNEEDNYASNGISGF